VRVRYGRASGHVERTRAERSLARLAWAGRSGPRRGSLRALWSWFCLWLTLCVQKEMSEHGACVTDGMRTQITCTYNYACVMFAHQQHAACDDGPCAVGVRARAPRLTRQWTKNDVRHHVRSLAVVAAVCVRVAMYFPPRP
jgi:hypothetical protein